MSPTPPTDLFSHFRVELDAGNNPLFRGGDRITGHVKIQLKKEAVIDVIRIQFKGRAVTKDKKGPPTEKIFFDKDFILLERPPGKAEPGHFKWVADFEYSLPFQYVLPLGCPTSFEGGPNAFVRYFARVTFQTSESHSPVYIAKRHFSVYDVETVAAVDPQFEEPFTYRRTFASGGCCCKRKVYFELILPKRVYYAGEDIEARLLVDNINDERIANNIQYNIVERAVKPEVNDTDALKYPARVVKSAKIDGTNVEKTRNQVKIGSILIPKAAPLSAANAVAIASLPKDKSTPQLSPDDQASKLFEHPSVISQSRKEPIFRIHYALQILIGKFLIEVPFVVRPVESEDVRNLLRGKEEVPLKFMEADTTELLNREVLKEVRKVVDHYPEPDEQDKIFVGDPDYFFVPMVPTYTQRPVEEHAYTWPTLGTYGPNHKLIWHPDRKSTKEEKADRERQKREAKEEAKRHREEEKVTRKQQKQTNKDDKRAENELLISTEEQNPNESNPSVNAIEARSTTTEPDPSLIALQSTSEDAQSPMEVEEDKEEPKKSKAELKREEKERKAEEKRAKAQAKEQQKREKEQAKIDAKRSKQQAKEDAKRAKEEAKLAAKRQKEEKAQAERERKAQAKTQKETPKDDVEATPAVPVGDLQLAPQFDTDAEIVERTMVVTETVRTIEQHGDQPATVHETITVTEQKSGDPAPHTTTIEYTNTQPVVEDAIESSGLVEPHSSPIPEVTITEETGEFVANGVLEEEPQPNGHDPPTNGINGHHEEVEEEQEDAQSLKKKKQAGGGDAENIVPTEA